jgi:hypothetical protein
MKTEKGIYEKVTVEAAVTGWILRRVNRPAEIFTRWEALTSRLKHLLTSDGGQGDSNGK